MEESKVILGIDDLFLLEGFQIEKITQISLQRELAAILHAHPNIQHFLIHKNPAIFPFISKITKEYGPADDPTQLNKFIDSIVEAFKAELIQNKYPEVSFISYWELDEISSITPLNDKVVIDVGAGTGNIAFKLVELSRIVYAVEPATSLREFMRKKAKEIGITNLFVMDGFLQAIPLPLNSVEVLITSNVIWLGDMEEALIEVERIVKPEGYVIHLLLRLDTSLEKEKLASIHQTLTSSPWNYQFEEVDMSDFKETGIMSANALKIKYWKQIT
ncbi:MAG: class I SAM-dependent methyltransferase [Candidatus Hodarchaeota archaeon]